MSELDLSTSGKLSAVDLDELQLQAQGHAGELPRRFSMMSLLAFSFAIMNSWTGVVPLLLTDLSLGGAPAGVWTPVVAFVACSIITVGLAELASAFPSSGGQYHFAFMVAHHKYRAGAAFVTAWFNIIAYLIVCASATIIPAQVIAGLIEIYYPNYVVHQWLVWIIYAVMITLSTAIVTLGASLVPKTQSTFFWASLLGIGVMSITVLAASSTKQSAESVFTTWDNVSGWTPGFGFLISTSQSMWLYVCVDSATHIAEEIPQPGKYVPRVMITSMGLAILTVMLYTLAILFSSNDFTAISQSPLPIYEAYVQAIGSKAGVLFLCIWLIIIYFGCILGIVTTTGRLIWAFSRDNGMPFSPFFSQINKKLKVPVEANVLICVFCLCFGCIYIGSTVAFNTFISSAIVFLNLSYTIPQGMLLLRKRDEVLPERHFTLPRPIGLFCNGFACIWMVVYTVILSCPLGLPVTAESMNYVSVVFCGGLIFIAVLWFGTGKRTSFVGPKIQFGVLNGVNATAKNLEKGMTTEVQLKLSTDKDSNLGQ